MEIRESGPDDLAAIETLYPAAFPDEDLLPLVRELLAATAATRSLVATVDTSLVAHVVFATCGLPGGGDTAALLGPLAVAPDRQRRGFGGAIVRDGLRRLADDGFTHVFVLGDPGYYRRFGFTPDKTVRPPYLPPAESLPEAWRDAWQSQRLGNAAPTPAGELRLPAPWRHREYWLP